MEGKKITIKKGKFIRFKGNVTIYSPHKKIDGIWNGGSSWTVKNPLIRIGKCNHTPKKMKFCREFLTGEKTYFKKGREMIQCSDCGDILKLGEKRE